MPAAGGTFRLVQAALVAIHSAKMAMWFRAVDWTLPAPLLNVDYAQYFGRVVRMSGFLSDSGRIWGYDPFDMAGYVSGPFLEVGTHLLALAAHALSPLVPIERSLLWLEVAGLSLSPFLLIAAVRVAGGTRHQAWAAFALTLPLYGFLEPFSATMMRIGLWGFMVSSMAAPLQVALAWRWLATGTPASAVAVTAVSAALFGLHPAALVVVAVPNLLLFVLMARDAGPRRAAVTLLLAGIALLANLYWIRPFVAFADWKGDAPYFVTAGFSDIWGLFSPVGRGLFHGLRFVALAYLAALACFAVAALARRDRRLAIVAGGWMGWLFFVGFFGSAVPVLTTLQPGRNVFPFWILTAVLCGMISPTAIFARRDRRWLAGSLFGVAVVMMFTHAALAAWYFPPLSNRLPRGQEAMLEYLRASPVKGRVLLECVDAALPHVADIAPARTGRMFLGGQHPGNFLTARFTLFTGLYRNREGLVADEPVAFGRPLRQFGEETFSRYLAGYNVGEVVSRSDGMRRELERLGALFEPPVRAGAYRVFRVRATSGWLAEGSGDVSFDYDRIRIRNASPGRIVIKSHWIRTFRSEPPVPLAPVPLLEDPIPFIGLDNAAGHKDIEIYNAGL